MQIAVFYATGKEQEGKAILASLLERKMNVQGFLVGERWEKLNGDELEHTLVDITQVIVILSPDILLTRWLSFVTGFAFGRRADLLFLVDSSCERAWSSGEVPEFLRRAEAFNDCRKLIEYAVNTYTTQARKESIESAREALIQRGCAITEDQFCEVVKNGDRELVELFLQTGYSPDTSSDRGTPVLHTAARYERSSIVELLIERGADIDLVSGDRGNTALMEAAGRGSLSVVTTLLDAGASKDEYNSNGRTALTLAVADGFLDVGTELLNRGADPWIPDNLGMTALKYAELYGYQEIISKVTGESGQS